MSFGIKPNEILLLQNPLYGICNAGVYCGATFSDHVLNDLKMNPLDGDPSLYIKVSGAETIGLLVSNIEESMLAGNKEFSNDIWKTMERFETRPIQWDDFEFVGVNIRTIKCRLSEPEFQICQADYVEKLREIPLDATSNCLHLFVRL